MICHLHYSYDGFDSALSQNVSCTPPLFNNFENHEDLIPSHFLTGSCLSHFKRNT